MVNLLIATFHAIRTSNSSANSAPPESDVQLVFKRVVQIRRNFGSVIEVERDEQSVNWRGRVHAMNDTIYGIIGKAIGVETGVLSIGSRQRVFGENYLYPRKPLQRNTLCTITIGLANRVGVGGTHAVRRSRQPSAVVAT
jgi:hypothetical protein